MAMLDAASLVDAGQFHVFRAAFDCDFRDEAYAACVVLMFENSGFEA